MKFLLPLLVAALFAHAPVTAQYVGMTGSYGQPRLSAVALRNIHVSRLNSLRDEAIRRQVEDGGKLSPTSRAEFQLKLDRINKYYARDLRNNNIFSLDANGSPVPAVN